MVIGVGGGGGGGGGGGVLRAKLIPHQASVSNCPSKVVEPLLDSCTH